MITPNIFSNTHFNDNLLFVSKVRFNIGTFHEGCEEKIYTIRGDDVITKVDREFYLMPVEDFNFDNAEMDKDTLLNGLVELNIGEWNREYPLPSIDIAIRDAFSWSLDIYFSNGARPVQSHGSNNYPSNFAKLLELFNIRLVTMDELREKTIRKQSMIM